MSITLLLCLAAVVIAGLFTFVPEVHTAIVNAYKTASDDLDKIAADGKALVARLEGHAAAQSTAAADLASGAAALTAASNTATTNAQVASSAAVTLKSALTSVAAK